MMSDRTPRRSGLTAWLLALPLLLLVYLGATGPILWAERHTSLFDNQDTPPAGALWCLYAPVRHLVLRGGPAADAFEQWTNLWQ